MFGWLTTRFSSLPRIKTKRRMWTKTPILATTNTRNVIGQSTELRFEKIWRKKATKIWPQTFNSNWYNQLFSIWKPITNYISRVKTHIPPASSLLLLLPHLIVWSRPLKSHFGQQLGKNIRGGPHLQYSQRLLNNTTNQIQSRREFQIIEISPFLSGVLY